VTNIVPLPSTGWYSALLQGKREVLFAPASDTTMSAEHILSNWFTFERPTPRTLSSTAIQAFGTNTVGAQVGIGTAIQAFGTNTVGAQVGIGREQLRDHWIISKWRQSSDTPRFNHSGSPPSEPKSGSASWELSFGRSEWALYVGASEASSCIRASEETPRVRAESASAKIIDSWISGISSEEAYNLLLRYAARYGELLPDGFVDAVTRSSLKGESLLDLLHLLIDACQQEGVSTWPSAIAQLLLQSDIPSRRYAAADILALAQDDPFARWALTMALKKERNDIVHAMIEAALR
jgi:hypothetical protein